MLRANPSALLKWQSSLTISILVFFVGERNQIVVADGFGGACFETRRLRRLFHRFFSAFTCLLRAGLAGNNIVERPLIEHDRSFYHWQRITNRSVIIFVDFDFADFDEVEDRFALNLAENCMLLLKPRTRLRGRHEKLRAVLVAPAVVGHGHDAPVRKSQPLVELVKEGLPVDTLAAGASSTRVASLHHEVLHHAVEYRVVVVAFEAELNEVATCSRGFSRPEVDFNLAIVGLQDDFGGGRGLLRLLNKRERH